MTGTVHRGRCASPGLASGWLHVVDLLRDTGDSVHRSPKEEVRRLELAFVTVEKQVLDDAAAARGNGETETADVFEAHAVMLSDADLRGAVLDKAGSGVRAADAVSSVIGKLAETFRASPSEYMRARVADLLDLQVRLLDGLAGRDRQNFALGADVILVAADFTPSMTAGLTAENCGGLVALEGSFTAHASIFARNAGIPAITNCDIGSLDNLDGREVVLDATDGRLVVEPDEATLADFAAAVDLSRDERRAEHAARGVPVEGPYGPVPLLANVGSLEDVRLAVERDAEGVGLFRTEFLYLSRENAPSEDEQFEIYDQAASLLLDKPLVIRTLDIGADKQVPYLEQPAEPNPALGVRGVRLCLRRPEVFIPQIRALVRACARHASIWVMVPMVTDVSELKAVATLMREQVGELTAIGVEAAMPTRLGVMIETPAAVVCVDELAASADFFSIGTNDLVQYFYAIDRESPVFGEIAVDDEPILTVVERIVRAGRAAEIPVGVCGEMASRPEMAERLVALGVHELSMSSSAILTVRRHLAGAQAVARI